MQYFFQNMFILSSYGVFASLHASLMRMTEKQEKDASEGNTGAN